jgi:hypothetical protein
VGLLGGVWEWSKGENTISNASNATPKGLIFNNDFILFGFRFVKFLFISPYIYADTHGEYYSDNEEYINRNAFTVFSGQYVQY